MVSVLVQDVGIELQGQYVKTDHMLIILMYSFRMKLTYLLKHARRLPDIATSIVWEVYRHIQP